MADFKVYTITEVAGLLRVSRMTVYRLISSGQLDAYRVGRSYRVPEEALDAYLNAASGSALS